MTEGRAALPSVTISFTTSLREQAAAGRTIFRNTWAWWLAMGMFVAVPLGLAGWTASTRSFDLRALTMLLVGVGGALFWHYGLAWVSLASARRGIPAPNGPFTWTLDTEGCSVVGPNTTASLKWSAIIRTRETADFFLLYMGRNLAQFIPKRAVASDDLPQVRLLLGRVGAHQ